MQQSTEQQQTSKAKSRKVSKKSQKSKIKEDGENLNKENQDQDEHLLQHLEDQYNMQENKILQESKFQLTVKLRELEIDIQEIEQQVQQKQSDLSNLEENQQILEDQLLTANEETKHILETRNYLQGRVHELKQLKGQDQQTKIDRLEILQNKQDWKEEIQLQKYAIFQNDLFMTERKKKALSGRAGRVIVDFALLITDISHFSASMSYQKQNDNFNQHQPFTAVKERKIQNQKKDHDLQQQYAVQQLPVKFNYEVCLFTVEFQQLESVKKVQFQDLLEDVCRYWQLDTNEHILVDENFSIWPTYSQVIDEQQAFKTKGSNYMSDDISIEVVSKHILKSKGLEFEQHQSRQVFNFYQLYLDRKRAKEDEEIKRLNIQKQKRQKEEVDDQDKQRKQKIKQQTSLVGRLRYKYEYRVRRFLEQLRLDKEYNVRMLKTFIYLILYLAFFIGYLWAVKQEHQIYNQHTMTQQIMNNFIEANLNLDNKSIYSQSPQNVTYYLVSQILDSYYDDTYYNGVPIQSDQISGLDYVAQAYAIGVPRIRQKRITNNSCQHALNVQQQFYKLQLGYLDGSCYAVYTDDLQETQRLDISDVSEFLFQYNATELQQFDWKNAPDSGWKSEGLDGFYGHDGNYFITQRYILNLPRLNSTYSRSDVRRFLLKYIPEFYTSLKTRGVILEFGLYSPTLDRFAACEIVIEHMVTGLTTLKIKVLPFRLFAEWTSADQARGIIEQLVYGSMSIILMVLAVQLFQQGIVKVLWNFWNMMQLSFIALAVTKNFLRDELKNSDAVLNFDFVSDSYVDLISLAEAYRLYMVIDGFSLMLGFLLIFKYLQMSKQINTVWNTLKQTQNILIPFYLLIFLSFFVYCVCAYILYGSQNHEYHTFFESIQSILYGTIGQFDYLQVRTIHPKTSPAFFFLFIIPMYFVLYRLFQAILLQNYQLLAQQAELDHEMDAIFFYIKMTGVVVYYVAILPIKLLFTLLFWPCTYSYKKYFIASRVKQRKAAFEEHKQRKFLKRKLKVYLEEGEDEMKEQVRKEQLLEDKAQQAIIDEKKRNSKPGWLTRIFQIDSDGNNNINKNEQNKENQDNLDEFKPGDDEIQGHQQVEYIDQLQGERRDQYDQHDQDDQYQNRKDEHDQWIQNDEVQEQKKVVFYEPKNDDLQQAGPKQQYVTYNHLKQKLNL